jgi:hypothetical protein
MEVAKILFLSGIVAAFVVMRDIFKSESDRSAVCSAKAAYEFPGTSARLILERTPTHLFLAEYERTLILCNGAKETSRRNAAEDTGGYSRMEVYRISESEYFLKGDLDFDRYSLDIQNNSFRDAILEKIPRNAKLVGAFDRYDRGGWRFLPAYQWSSK